MSESYPMAHTSTVICEFLGMVRPSYVLNVLVNSMLDGEEERWVEPKSLLLRNVQKIAKL